MLERRGVPTVALGRVKRLESTLGCLIGKGR